MKKISIDDNNYIKVLPNGDFEIQQHMCTHWGKCLLF